MTPSWLAGGAGRCRMPITRAHARAGFLRAGSQPERDEDLGAVGAVGVPSAVAISFDPEAVVAFRVVPFAEEAGVLLGGFPAEFPFEEVVELAPVGGGVTAGEHAALVAQFGGLADVRREDALGAADVHRAGVGVEDDPGEGAVAERPAGAGG